MIHGLTIQRLFSIECLTIGLKRCEEVYRIRSSRKEYLPRLVRLNGQGQESLDGNEFWYIPAPFRFCLNCGVSYGFREKSDFGKLTTLGSEGRRYCHDASLSFGA